MISKPPVPDDVRRPQVPGLVDGIRQRCVRLAHRVADRQVLGSRPSRGVVICGMPRSGSTLLQLMLETAYPNSRQFGRERAALHLARHVWPSRHSLLISKRPNDVFWIDEIREAYRGRAAGPRFIVTSRDPRAVLTSRHSGRPEYYVSIERWRAIFAHIRYVRAAPDVTVVDYGDLVREPANTQSRLVGAIGEEPSAPFESFSDAIPSGFKTTALNGVRPIDTASLYKWREPEHAGRISELLSKVPELTSLLVEEGYEPDDSWAADYR
jgi:hypothetical protein